MPPRQGPPSPAPLPPLSTLLTTSHLLPFLLLVCLLGPCQTFSLPPGKGITPRRAHPSSFEKLSRDVPVNVELLDWSDHLTPYAEAWDFQKRAMEAKLQDPMIPDAVILLQHPATYTLGTGSTAGNLLFEPSSKDAPCQVFRTERGGEVTFHGPGQLVMYPILDLSRSYKEDLHWYLRALEETIIRTLGKMGIEGAGREEGLTGVWVRGAKVAAVGVKVRRWVTMHGVALNVSPDMRYFSHIVPCGIQDRAVAAVTDYVPGATVASTSILLAQAFEEVFGARLQVGSGETALVERIGPPTSLSQ